MTSYRQMRRHARRARRAGMQPMMVIGSGDGLPELAVLIIARWAWRYRSELAPLGIAVLVAGFGLYAHAALPGWWPHREGHRHGTFPIARLRAEPSVA
jgi:hypothetical protein